MNARIIYLADRRAAAEDRNRGVPFQKNSQPSYLCCEAHPDTDQIVIIQDYCEGTVTTLGARYTKNGQWIDEETAENITKHLSPLAMWFESVLQRDVNRVG